jgi:DNA-binding LytR/AlgR family response regulator
LKKLLREVWPELDIVGGAADGVRAMQLLEKHQPQVLFLDIQMPGLSGLEVARAASGRCHVVFVTAYDKYAVSAFEHGAVDYVMKPVTLPRLVAACNRLRERLSEPPANLEALVQRLLEASTRKREYLRWINVESSGKVRLITVDEICYFQADAKYTRLVTAGSEALIRLTLKELLEEALDPALFWQIHRSTVVNVDAIAEVTRDVRGLPVLHLKQRAEKLPVSQPFAHLFRQM